MATLFVYKSARPKNLSFLTGLSIMLAILAGVSFWGARHISAATCTSNDIIKCGYSTPSSFIRKVRANNNGVNNNPDLQAIYAHYGLNEGDYDNFAAHAVPGEAMRDGRIIVGGKVVGTGGMSIGRLKSFQGSNPFPVSIGGHTYWGNVNSQVFASGVNEIPVDVLFSSSGRLKFAVMPSCGNPEIPSSTPPPKVKPSAACKVLNKQPVQGRPNTFNFTAAATTAGSASITKFVYEFGDGSPVVTEMSGDTPVTHTYKKSGTFTATVTVFANLPGNPNTQLPPVEMCAKQITIAPSLTPPPAVMAACRDLVGLPVEDSSNQKLKFSFTATAEPNSTATLVSADFDFGDGVIQRDAPANSDGMTVSIDHTYTSAGTFTVSAVLRFQDKNNPNKLVTAPACTTVVTPVVPTATPPSPPHAQEAAVTQALPNTGAGNVIGLFFGVSALGTLIFRQLMLRRLKER